jgi:hypothetical protein
MEHGLPAFGYGHSAVALKLRSLGANATTHQNKRSLGCTRDASSGARGSAPCTSRQGNVNDGHASGFGSINGLYDALNGWFDRPPSPHSQGDQRDFPVLEILLVLHVLIGCEQNFKTCGFGGVEQGPVAVAVPTFSFGFNHNVIIEISRDRTRSALIEQDPHQTDWL